MANRLLGKTALITAAAQGIGRATALAFAREGATVWATDLNEAALATLKTENPDLNLRKFDVRSAEQIDAIATEIGASLDTLFNCAGYVHSGTILDATERDWDFSFELNVKSMFRICQRFLPVMLERGGGTITNVASVASSVKGLQRRFVYGASKAAVIGLTKSIAADFVTRGIRCNAICPGTVESPSLEERITAMGGTAEMRAQMVARQPIGRFGRPEEIADLAVYLASDESAFTTGQAHIIDGGLTL
jgi:2-keto-3-deoxy-L-fuconate dehydrogenase